MLAAGPNIKLNSPLPGQWIPIHSPKVASVELVRKGRVRRGKLYYLRGRVGKAAKVKEVLG